MSTRAGYSDIPTKPHAATRPRSSSARPSVAFGYRMTVECRFYPSGVCDLVEGDEHGKKQREQAFICEDGSLTNTRKWLSAKKIIF